MANFNPSTFFQSPEGRMQLMQTTLAPYAPQIGMMGAELPVDIALAGVTPDVENLQLYSTLATAALQFGDQPDSLYRLAQESLQNQIQDIVARGQLTLGQGGTIQQAMQRALLEALQGERGITESRMASGTYGTEARRLDEAFLQAQTALRGQGIRTEALSAAEALRSALTGAQIKGRELQTQQQIDVLQFAPSLVSQILGGYSNVAGAQLLPIQTYGQLYQTLGSAGGQAAWLAGG
jgi:hypothetical protein